MIAAPSPFEAFAITKGDESHARLLKTIAKTEVLSLGDWRLSVLTAMQRRHMLAILEDRHCGDPPSAPATPRRALARGRGRPDSLADAILDRLIHNAARLALSGESIRKRNDLTKTLGPAGQD